MADPPSAGYECVYCEYKTPKRFNYEVHLKSNKHLRKYVVKAVTKTPPLTYVCEPCKYDTVDKNKYHRHIETKKHKQLVVDLTHLDPPRDAQDTVIEPARQVATTAVALPNSAVEVANIVQLVLKEIKEIITPMTDTMTALVHKVGNTTNNTNTNNSHNKTFNLNFFLNEQCKDAMNIQDFVESIPVNMAELESLGDRGYVEGMAQLISDQLASMDIHKRPIHCTDLKRQVLHVKHDNKWEKEVETYPILNGAIKDVSYRFFTSLGKWIELHPDATRSNSMYNDKYLRLIKQSTGGHGDFDANNLKIMRRLAKMVVVDKDNT